MARVPASKTARKRIEAMISGEGEGVDKSELVRAAARLILEEEVTDALGRDFYEHGAKSGSGYRNGYRQGRLKSAEGRSNTRCRRCAIVPSRFARRSAN